MVVQVSWDTELFKSTVLLGRHIEMAGKSVVTLGKETAQLLLRSPWREFLKYIEFYLKDGLEMAIQ